MSLLLLFRPLTGIAPPPPPPPPPVAEPPPVISEGGSGYISPRYSSLTKTWNFPGLREIIEKEDQLIVDMIVMAVISETLQ